MSKLYIDIFILCGLIAQCAMWIGFLIWLGGFQRGWW
jgi:hypothetical protein